MDHSSRRVGPVVGQVIVQTGISPVGQGVIRSKDGLQFYAKYDGIVLLRLMTTVKRGKRTLTTVK